ncbi:MAG TPA: esterase-like activity of phytase family protein [Chitinophagaceae bacterium]
MTRARIVELRKASFLLCLNILLLSASITLLFGCKTSGKATGQGSGHSISKLVLLDTYELPSMMSFKGTTVAGLSGIDYDAKNDLYYIISDDRSDVNPSRFYTTNIRFTEKNIDSIFFRDVTTLLDKEGRAYSNQQADPLRRVDPEGIRYNANKDVLAWSNEGERTTINGKLVLCDPAITIIDKKGNYQDSFFLPSNMHVTPVEKGIRRNGAFEGLSFDSGYKFVYVCVEEPLYEDGPRAGLGDSTAWIRFIKFDAATKRPVAQYAYEIDAVPYPANPTGEFKINGVPEILYTGNDQLLVIERSFSTGKQSCAVRIYIADLSTASDVSNVSSLLSRGAFKPAIKKLLLNMDSLGIYIDNVEGVTFGPALPNGNSTLIFVTDDNFTSKQKTQFFFFEVIR